MRQVKKLINAFTNASFLSRSSFYIFLYSVLLLVGMWHAFPNLLVVADESPYVGGVLRSLQLKTLLPHIDYSYTLSFYANYILFLPFLFVLFISHGGDMAGTIAFLSDHTWIAYFIPRLVSVFAVLIMVVLFFKIARNEGRTGNEIFIISTITFTNILFMSIAHTGKMWALSLLLWFLSFYFFSRALERMRTMDVESGRIYTNPFFWTPFFAFVSVANFPVNILSCIGVLWLGVRILERRVQYASYVYGCIAGLVSFGILLGLNWDGWVTQNSITQVGIRSYTDIALYFIYGGMMIMPLHLLYGLFCLTFTRTKIKDEVWILLYTLGAYVVFIFARAPWVGESHVDFFRYFFYPVFFTGLLFLFFSMRGKMVGYTLAVVSIIFVGKLLYLLSIPTTYNLAERYLSADAHDERIVNQVARLDLRKDMESSLLIKEERCGSRCMLARSGVMDDGLFVVDDATVPREYEKVLLETPSYLVVRSDALQTPAPSSISIRNGLAGGRYQSIDYNLGTYTWEFLTQERLGENIVIERGGVQ